MRALVLLVLLASPGPALAEDLGDLGVPVRATPNLLIDSKSSVTFTPTTAFSFGPKSEWLWGGRCYLVVSPGGRTRIEGEEREPCINALDEAVRLARAEERVNRKRRK